MKHISAPIRMPGMASGTSISRKTWNGVAPRSNAASRIGSGTIEMPRIIGNSMKGR